MKKPLIILIVTVLAGCYFTPGAAYWSTDDIPYVGNTTFNILFFVTRHVTYKEDGYVDYWQSPGETYAIATGDCEDYAILAMFMIERDTDHEVLMARGQSHAWILVDNVHWNPQTVSIITNPDPVVVYYTLEQVIPNV